MRGHGLIRLGLLGLVFAVLSGPARTFAQHLELRVESDDLHENLPFILTVAARGFGEEPQPILTKLVIPGCKVTPLGVVPNVSSMVQIVNGQRSESRDVTFAYRFRIEAPQPGTYTVPALLAEQATPSGKKKAQSPPAQFQVKGLEESRDMQVRLVLPERPVWVGETFSVSLEWYLRKDVSNRTFVVPLFDEDAWVEVEPGPGTGPGNDPRLGGFHAGPRQLELPYRRDKTTLDGVEYTRFRFLARITPTKAGVLSTAAPRVVAELEAGVGRDGFGFAVPMTKLYSASGKPVHLEVRPLPQKDRPESFKNAVGTAFSIEVQAGRTVVRVGDPIELKILLRGNGRLAGLILPNLYAAGLSRDLFTVPDEAAAGELLDDGKGKLFRVSVRLRSTQAGAIPPLSFSYFDPEKGEYRTSQSQPIALSVQGSAIVGAQDVQGPAPSFVDSPQDVRKDGGKKAQKDPPAAFSLVGADLALSDERATLRRALSPRGVAPWLGLLYGFPLMMLLAQIWRLRTQKSREHEGEARKCLRLLLRELDAAAAGPAREAAPRVAGALRTLRRQFGQYPAEGDALLARLETEAYSPQAAQGPLSPALLKEVRDLAEGWVAPVPRTGPPRGTVMGLVLLMSLSLGSLGSLGLMARPCHAEDGGTRLRAAREAYRQALTQGDRDRRRGDFAQAETLYRELAAAHPDAPELQADWGNAALLAQEPGRAALAYRRALRLDPGKQRARRNLGFLRDRLPEWLPRPRTQGAMDSFFFWQHLWSLPMRHLLLALGFAAALLLLVPWSIPAGRRRLLRGAAVLPAVFVAAMAISLLVERDGSADGVVLDHGVLLRSADSLGAPQSLSNPLPAGAEVAVLETRGDWTRIELADGQNGWVPTSAVERIDRPIDRSIAQSRSAAGAPIDQPPPTKPP